MDRPSATSAEEELYRSNIHIYINVELWSAGSSQILLNMTIVACTLFVRYEIAIGILAEIWTVAFLFLGGNLPLAPVFPYIKKQVCLPAVASQHTGKEGSTTSEQEGE